MIYNVTYKDKDIQESIDELVGKPYSFMSRLRMGGIGSKRLMIRAVSPNFSRILFSVSDIHYGSIELRPKGIIVHTTRRLDRFSWPIPYYKLVIYNHKFFTVHADGGYIQFLKNKLYVENKSFIDKVMQLKSDYELEHSFR